MKTKRVLLCLAALLLAAVILLTVGGIQMLRRQVTLEFEKTDAYIQNPLQGFYVQVDSADHEGLAFALKEGAPLVLVACNLNGYQDKELDAAKLEELESILAAAKGLGLGVIFRAAYGFSEGFDTVEPANITIVMRHIEQMAPVLNRHAANLVCVQAGLLGPWGEWHSSNHMEKAADVALAWVRRLDAPTIVQLRRPLFVRQAVEAGADIRRLGFHNDALLSTESDMGTYISADATKVTRGEDLAWVDKNLAHGLFGGEMPETGPFTEANTAVEEFRLLHLAYLNSQYNQAVLESFAAQQYEGENLLDYVTRKMGSRMYLQSAKLHRHTLRPARTLRVELQVANDGFAPPHPTLQYALALRQGEQQVLLPLQPGQMKTRGTNGDFSVSASLTLPEEFTLQQKFTLELWMGFGEAGSPEAPYTAANQGAVMEDGYLTIARYLPAGPFWKLEEA